MCSYRRTQRCKVCTGAPCLARQVRHMTKIGPSPPRYEMQVGRRAASQPQPASRPPHPPVTSPMAQTLGAVVRENSSTWI